MFSSVVLAASYLAKRDRTREAGDGSVLATLQPPIPGLPARLGCRGERPEAADSVAGPPRNCSIIPDKRFSIRAVSCCRPRQPLKKSTVLSLQPGGEVEILQSAGSSLPPADQPADGGTILLKRSPRCGLATAFLPARCLSTAI